MGYGILLIVLAVLLVLLSAWLRIGNLRKKNKRLSLEPQDTFLSREVKNVVANAGGIYVSFNLAASFLQLDLIDKFALLGISFDPLAALALILALVQPIVWPNSS